MANPKAQPNREIYLRILRRMTPAQRVRKAFELSDFTKRLFIAGLRRRHPDLPEAEFRALLHERLRRCHNQNY